MKKIKLIACILGVSSLLGNLIFVTRAFIMAFFFNNHRYAMNMNSIHEGFWEIIFILALLPFGLYVIYLELKRLNWFGIGVKT